MHSTYTLRFTFRGVDCRIKITPSHGEKYKVLVQTNKRLSDQDLQSLHQYMQAEGFYFEDQLPELE